MSFGSDKQGGSVSGIGGDESGIEGAESSWGSDAMDVVMDKVKEVTPTVKETIVKTYTGAIDYGLHVGSNIVANAWDATVGNVLGMVDTFTPKGTPSLREAARTNIRDGVYDIAQMTVEEGESYVTDDGAVFGRLETGGQGREELWPKPLITLKDPKPISPKTDKGKVKRGRTPGRVYRVPSNNRRIIYN
jgi:hypothetical protein